MLIDGEGELLPVGGVLRRRRRQYRRLHAAAAQVDDDVRGAGALRQVAHAAEAEAELTRQPLV